jgi:hypothetical protein
VKLTSFPKNNSSRDAKCNLNFDGVNNPNEKINYLSSRNTNNLNNALNSSGSFLVNNPYGKNTNQNNISSYLKDVEDENIAYAIKVNEIGMNGNAYLSNFNSTNARKVSFVKKLTKENNEELTTRSANKALDSATQRTPNKERNLEINFDEEFEEAENSLIANKINITNNNLNNAIQNYNKNDSIEKAVKDNMRITTREKKNLFYSETEPDLPHNLPRNKLIQSVNEKDFLEMNLNKNAEKNYIYNAGYEYENLNPAEIKTRNTDNDMEFKNHLNDFEAKEISIFNSNPNLAFNKINNNDNKINSARATISKMNLNNNHKIKEKIEKNINQINLKDKSITLENNALLDSNSLHLPKNSINNMNIDNHELSGISKLSYTNLNSQQNSVIFNFGKKESILNFPVSQNYNAGFVNNNILDSIKLNDNSLLTSNVNSKVEEKNNLRKDNIFVNNKNEEFNANYATKINGNNNLMRKNTAHKINFKENDFNNYDDNKNSKLNNILNNNLNNKYGNNDIDSINNKEPNGFNSNRENIVISDKIKNYYNTYELNNFHENNNNILASSHSNNLYFNNFFNQNINKNNKNSNINLNTDPSRKAYQHDDYLKQNILISNEHTNNILNTIKNTLNNTQNSHLSDNAEESENNSSIEEFKKNEISEGICDADLNNSSANDNKSVISSNVLSHIHTHKMLTGIRSDTSFISYQTKSDNGSRIDTIVNNYQNYYDRNNFNNFFLPTEAENFANLNNLNVNNFISNNNANYNNPFNNSNNNCVNNTTKFRNNPQNYLDDQEYEMLNDNYDGFKYIETPKSSKFTSLIVNVLNTNPNPNINVLNTLNNNPAGLNVYNNTSEKIIFNSTNQNANLQVNYFYL